MSRAASVEVDFTVPETASQALPDQGRVAIATLGCKVNSYESELIRSAAMERQWQVVDFREQADLYIINTCTVTSEADRQARQMVRRAVRANPSARVVVTGCYAQIDPQGCAGIPGVDLVLGNDRKLDMDALLSPPAADGVSVQVGDLDEQVTIPEQILSGYEGQTRAFVQIQQGCDQGCTYCIIHVARGPSRSFPPTLIKQQVRELVRTGYREIVICGVDLGAYGDDYGGGDENYDLSTLLRELVEIEGNFRLRIGSLDPAHISDDLVQLFADEPKLCPHVHLSLQSGDEMILKRMKRRYSPQQVRDRVNALSAARPDLVLGADIMAGFPTETDVAFENSLCMMRDLQIAWPHVFAYSEREGTPAARIPDDKRVPKLIRKQRADRLRKVGAEIRANLLQRKLGQVETVLTEAQNERGLLGRAGDYSPCRIEGAGNASAGQWLKVKYTSFDDDTLIAEPVGNN